MMYCVREHMYASGWQLGSVQPGLNAHTPMSVNLEQYYDEASDSDSEDEKAFNKVFNKKVEGPTPARRMDVPEPVPEPDASGAPQTVELGGGAQINICAHRAGEAVPVPVSAPWRNKENWPVNKWTGSDWAKLSLACEAPLTTPWRKGLAPVSLAALEAIKQPLPVRCKSGVSSISTGIYSPSTTRSASTDLYSESEQDGSDRSVSEPEAEAAQMDGEVVEAHASSLFAVGQLLAWRAAVEPTRSCPRIMAAAVEEAADASPVVAAPTSTAPAAAQAEEQGELVVSANSWAAQMRARRSSGAPATPSTQQRRTDGTGSLLVSGTSWAAHQRARRSGAGGGEQQDDAEIARALKSKLNKLTLEKFEELSNQIMCVPMRTTTHVECLITEVFEKAITQHHFIDMYADLCSLLHEHFIASPVGNDPKFSFKKLLLNECQKSFERNLEPPQGLAELDQEERTLMEFRYKHRMIGNIKFIGALLVRKMLAGKVLLAILQELTSEPTPEALESLAALLTATGPVFDSAEWAFRGGLEAIFAEVSAIIQKPTCEPRSRCLLKDVLDFRSRGWKQSRRPTQEAPKTLREVSEKQALEQCGK